MLRRFLRIFLPCTYGLHWRRAVPGKRTATGRRELIDTTGVKECAWCRRRWFREHHVVEIWVTEKEHMAHEDLARSQGLVRHARTQNIVLRDDVTRMIGVPKDSS